MKVRATFMMMAATLAPLPLVAQDSAPTAPAAVCTPAAEAPAVSALAHLPITSDLYVVIRGEELINSFVGGRDAERVEGAAVVISPGMAEVLQAALPTIRLGAMSNMAGRKAFVSVFVNGPDVAKDSPVAKVWQTVSDEAEKEGVKCLTDFWRSTHLKPIYAAFSVTPGNEEWLRDEVFTSFVKMIQDFPKSDDEVHFEKLEYKGFRGTRLTVLPPEEGADPEDKDTQLQAAFAGRNFCLLTRLVGNTMMVAVCEDPEELVLPSSPAESLAALPELRGPAANSPLFVQANLSVAATKAITEAVTQFYGGQADAWKRAFELYAKESPEQAETMAAGARGVLSLFSDFARMMKAANEKTAASALLRVWGGEGKYHGLISGDACGSSFAPFVPSLEKKAQAPETLLTLESAPFTFHTELPDPGQTAEAALAVTKAKALLGDGNKPPMDLTNTLLPDGVTLLRAAQKALTCLGGGAVVVDVPRPEAPAGLITPRVGMLLGVTDAAGLAEGLKDLREMGGKLLAPLGVDPAQLRGLPITLTEQPVDAAHHGLTPDSQKTLVMASDPEMGKELLATTEGSATAVPGFARLTFRSAPLFSGNPQLSIMPEEMLEFCAKVESAEATVSVSEQLMSLHVNVSLRSDEEAEKLCPDMDDDWDDDKDGKGDLIDEDQADNGEEIDEEDGKGDLIDEVQADND